MSLLASERCERSDSDNAVSNLFRSALDCVQGGKFPRLYGGLVSRQGGQAIIKKDRARVSPWRILWLMLTGQTINLDTRFAHKKMASGLESHTHVNGRTEGEACALSGKAFDYLPHISTVFEEMYDEK